MHHAALSPGNVAVITGGASGIGLAAAKRLAGMDLKIAIVDLGNDRLLHAVEEIEAASGEPGSVLAISADVSSLDSMREVERSVRTTFGAVHVLMNNAGIQPGSTVFGPEADWDRVLEVNLGGVVKGTQAFAPGMIAQGTPGLIVNTGSKQGITTPPGDPAYNVSKAGVKAFTEALQHALRNTESCRVSAHLLIPGFVFTPLAAGGKSEKPDAAWTPEQTVDFMLARLETGDFYILCPDNDVTREIDQRRILWAAGDIVENRPPLSRWHPDYADRFKAFLQE